MKNVYELRQQEKTYQVLSSKFSIDLSKKTDTVVICNLYYEDILEYYLDYLKEASQIVQIIIVSSNNSVLEKSKRFLKNNEIIFLQKKNRGRDISALLIAAKEYLQKYEYICFVHDKKRHEWTYDKDFKLWVRNIWENTVASKEYVNNVRNSFEYDKSLGLLLPPEPFGDVIYQWEYADWYDDNYNILSDLCSRLGLSANIDREYPPMSISSAFWCRSTILSKLLGLDLKYEDFPDEPMSSDGTISHAIERIMPYLAQDAGYRTGTVLSDRFVPELLAHSQILSYKAISFTAELFGIRNIAEFEYIEQFRTDLMEHMKGDKKLYLFGAGKEGELCLNYLRTIAIIPDGFVVSTISEAREKSGLQILSCDEIIDELKNNIVIITPFYDDIQKEIEGKLIGCGIMNYIFWRRRGSTHGNSINYNTSI